MINVSNIERFAIHDGPGIRTAVFLKGCPLHCPWCANPETWTVQPVLMHRENLCERCHTCEHVCPNRAVSFQDDRFQYKLRIFEVVGDAGLIASIETTEEFSKAMISMLRSDTKEHYRQQGIRHTGLQRSGPGAGAKRASAVGSHTDRLGRTVEG